MKSLCRLRSLNNTSAVYGIADRNLKELRPVQNWLSERTLQFDCFTNQSSDLHDVLLLQTPVECDRKQQQTALNTRLHNNRETPSAEEDHVGKALEKANTLTFRREVTFLHSFKEKRAEISFTEIYSTSFQQSRAGQ